MTPEQIRVRAQARKRKAEAEAQASSGVSMSDVLSETTRSLAEAVPEGPLRGAVAGLSGGLASVPEGLRQLFNAATGDEAELSTLNREADQRLAAQREIVGENTGSEFVGSLASTLVPGSAAVKALEKLGLAGRAMSGTGVINKALRTGGAGFLGGAAAGASQSLGEKQEKSGERLSDTLIAGLLGGTFGAVAPVVKQGVTKAQNWMKKTTPDLAMEDFFTQTTGTSRGTDRNAVVEELRGKTSSKVDSLKGAFNRLYKQVEQNPGLPEVPLVNTQLGPVDPDIVELLGQNGSAARVLKVTREAAENPTQILGSSGTPLTTPHRGVSFEDVSKTRKYLRGLINNEKDSAKRSVLNGILDRLDEDLGSWAQTSPEARTALDQLNNIDQLYKKRMGPMINPKTPLGDWRRSGYTEQRMDTSLLSPRSGSQVTELTQRVPGTKDAARQYYASKTLSSGGNRALLSSNSTRDVLFSPSEREYMDKLVEGLKGQTEEGDLIKFFEGVNRKLGSPFPVDKSMLPYGQYPISPERRNAIADLIRGWMGGRAVVTEE